MHADRTAALVAERIARAQDMLGRLGERDAYEPNYAREKLLDAARCCIEASAILGEPRDTVEGRTGIAWELGLSLFRLERRRAEARQGMACVRCLERGGMMTPLVGVRTVESAQVFEHQECREVGLAAAIEVEA